MFCYLLHTIPRVLIFVSLQSLHPGLHHIHRGVSKHTGCSSNSTTYECANVANIFGFVTFLKVVPEVQIDKESNGLVCALFDDGRCKALVGATYTCEYVCERVSTCVCVCVCVHLYVISLILRPSSSYMQH